MDWSAGGRRGWYKPLLLSFWWVKIRSHRLGAAKDGEVRDDCLGAATHRHRVADSQTDVSRAHLAAGRRLPHLPILFNHIKKCEYSAAWRGGGGARDQPGFSSYTEQIPRNAEREPASSRRNGRKRKATAIGGKFRRDIPCVSCMHQASSPDSAIRPRAMHRRIVDDWLTMPAKRVPAKQGSINGKLRRWNVRGRREGGAMTRVKPQMKTAGR